MYKAEVPSKQDTSQSLADLECKPNGAALEALEKATDRETQEEFTTRHEEGYDVETDEHLVVWAKLKVLSIKDEEDAEECRTSAG